MVSRADHPAVAVVKATADQQLAMTDDMTAATKAEVTLELKGTGQPVMEQPEMTEQPVKTEQPAMTEQPVKHGGGRL